MGEGRLQRGDPPDRAPVARPPGNEGHSTRSAEPEAYPIQGFPADLAGGTRVATRLERRYDTIRGSRQQGEAMLVVSARIRMDASRRADATAAAKAMMAATLEVPRVAHEYAVTDEGPIR